MKNKLSKEIVSSHMSEYGWLRPGNIPLNVYRNYISTEGESAEDRRPVARNLGRIVHWLAEVHGITSEEALHELAEIAAQDETI